MQSQKITVLYRAFDVINEDMHKCCKTNQMVVGSETIIVKINSDFGRDGANKKTSLSG